MKNNTQKTVMLKSFQHPHLNLPLPKEEEILKPFDRTLNKNFSGRGHVVKAVVQDDNRMGFTLIELLVVVLIIGILAAVAVPQYQLTVNKSRTVQAITMLKAITNAQEIYYLANGEYTDDLSELDIEVPKSLIGNTEDYNATESAQPDQYLFSCFAQRTCQAWAVNQNLPAFEFHLLHSPYQQEKPFQGKHWCKLTQPNRTDQAKKLCQMLGTLDNNAAVQGKYYLLN